MTIVLFQTSLHFWRQRDMAWKVPQGLSQVLGERDRATLDMIVDFDVPNSASTVARCSALEERNEQRENPWRTKQRVGGSETKQGDARHEKCRR